MSGLRMICKFYGGMVFKQNGKTTEYAWDYHQDKPVLKSEMQDRKKLAKSERAKWKKIKAQLQQDIFTANQQKP